MSAPVQLGFTYEVRMDVAIPLAWAKLLKSAGMHHYDLTCRQASVCGVINGLYNTACDGDWPSSLAVTWSDLDLVSKVAEQLEYHTADRELIHTIRAWLRDAMRAILRQRVLCMKIPGSAPSSEGGEDEK